MKFLVANDKGGVGKSLIAQFCVIAARGAGQDPRIVEYDRQPKQRRWFPGETESFPLTPDLGTLLATPEKLAGFWDPMIEWLREDRGLVVDFGAQAWELFEQWAALSGLSSFHDGSGVLVITPVTADIEAVEGAARVLEALPRLMPQARVLLLTLDKDGPVDSLAGLPEYDRLMAAARTSATVTLRALPVLRAEGWPALAARGLRLDQIVAPGGVPSSPGLPAAAAARAVNATRDWMRAAYGVFLPHLLTGQSPKKAAVAPVLSTRPQAPATRTRAAKLATQPESMGGGMNILRRRAFLGGS